MRKPLVMRPARTERRQQPEAKEPKSKGDAFIANYCEICLARLSLVWTELSHANFRSLKSTASPVRRRVHNGLPLQ